MSADILLEPPGPRPAGIAGSGGARWRRSLPWRILSQLGQLVLTLLVASFAVHLVISHAPGDLVLAVFRSRYGAGATPDPAVLDSIRHELGMDQSVLVRYGHWLVDLFHGDLGESTTRRVPVAELLVERVPVTLTLTISAAAIAFVLAVNVGLNAGFRPRAAKATLWLTQLGASLPDYFFALFLVLVFSLKLGWFPVSGWGSWAGLVLPVVALVITPWAIMTRLVMTSVQESVDSKWMRTARAKGVGPLRLRYRHTLPHALTSSVSLLGVLMSAALSSALVIEVVFAIPGVGRLLYEAVLERDVPVIQGALLVQVTLAVVANALASSAQSLLDPKQRSARRRRSR